MVPCFRYIVNEQKKSEEFGITEDDVSEIRQDINKFRFELVEIMRKNNFDVGNVRIGDGYFGGKRAKQMERRIMKGFNIDTVEDLVKDAFAKQQGQGEGQIDFFKVVADAIKSGRREQGGAGDAEKQAPDPTRAGGGQKCDSVQVTGTAGNFSPATRLAAHKFKRILGKRDKTKNNQSNNSKLDQASQLLQSDSVYLQNSQVLPRIPGSPSASPREAPPPSSPFHCSTPANYNSSVLNAAVIPCTIMLTESNNHRMVSKSVSHLEVRLEDMAKDKQVSNRGTSHK